MRKLLAVIISVLIAVIPLSVTSVAINDETNNKRLDAFIGDLAELVNNDALKNEISGNAALKYSNSTDNAAAVNKYNEKYTNRVIVKSVKKLNPLDSVSYIYGYNDLHILQFDNRESTLKAVEYYSSLSYVEFAEEDAYLYEAVSEEGVVYESAVDFPTSIQSNIFGFTEAKANSDGNEVSIAVIDSGVEIHHEFLEGRVIDSGVDVINNSGSANDDRGHGTHVAGIIVSNTLNNVTVHAYKALNASGSGTSAQIALAIDAAVEDGMDIINLSMQMQGTSDVLYESVKAAYDKGIAVIVAAGNAHVDLETNPYSPGGFEEAISVMSCTIDKVLSDTSNYGSPCDIAAPGDKVLSSYLNNTYKVSSGTSMAAPFVCAAAAYLLAKDNTLTPDEIDAKLDEQGIWMYGSYRAKYLQIGTGINVSDLTAAPSFVTDSCTFIGAMKVELTCTSENADIYYTTDNSAIVHAYSEPFYVSKTTTVKAFTLENGYLMSDVISRTYTLVAGNDTDFVVDENGTLIEYNGNLTDVSVPSCVNGIPILSVSQTAFSNNTQIQSVTFENTITEIKENSFKGCTNLVKITAASVKTIGAGAFEDCESFIRLLGSEVVEVGANAFLNCTKLVDFDANRLKTIGDGAFKNTIAFKAFSAPVINEIGNNAFENSGLTTAAISTAVKVGSNAFLNCKSLTGILLSNATEIGNGAFSGCDALTTVSINSLSAVEIGENAFKDCIGLQTVEIDAVNQIDKSIFSGCNALTSLTIGSVNVIGEGAFSGLEGLTTVAINSTSSIELGEGVFSDCKSLATVTFGSGIVTIPSYCFYNCHSLQELEFSVITLVGESAFENCYSLSDFSFNSVEAVEANSFKSSGLTSVVSNKLFTIDKTAFDNCTKLTSIAFDAITDVDLNMLSSCSNAQSFSFKAATSITFPQNGMVQFFPNVERFVAPKLSSLPDNTFADCRMFNTYDFSGLVTIGAGTFKNTAITVAGFNYATAIGDGAFANANELKEITLPRVTSINADMFKDCSGVQSVRFAGITELPADFDVSVVFPSLTSFSAAKVSCIPDYYFQNCVNLNSIVFSSSAQLVIGEGAFENCNISELSINAKQIGKNAFNGNALKTLEVGSLQTLDCDIFGSSKQTITSISFSAVKNINGIVFNDAKNLESISLNSLLAVPENCFKGLTKLTTVSLSSVKEIGEGAFYGCTSIQSLYLNHVTTLEKDSLRDCTALEVLLIESVTALGENAISGCSSLKIFDAPKLEQVDYDFLNGCINIETIIIDSVKELPSNGVSSPFAHLEKLSMFRAPSVTNVPDYAFADCKALTYADFFNAEYVGKYAFKGCPLTDTDSESVGCAEVIAEGAFMDSGIKTITSEATTVGDKAFANCENLLRVTLPQAKSIGVSAFENCTSLNRAELGEVESIQAKAFNNCTALRWVEHSGNPAIGDMAFYGCSLINNLERLNPYSIGSQAFYGTDIIYDKLELPELIKISENAFDGVEISNLILENVEEIYDVPENANVLIGSKVTAGAIDSNTTSTIYSPAGTVVSKYCLKNGVNYKEFNESNPIITNTAKIIYKHGQMLEFDALAFNTEYSWYGCNKSDCSDAVLLKTDQDYFVPVTGNNNENIYNYYYCVAKSTENGNVVNIKSNLINNTFKMVWDDSFNLDHEKGYYYSYEKNGVEALNALNIDDEYCVVDYSHQYGSTSVLGTGSKISFVEEGAVVKEYTVVLKGDVNGDGYVDALDCMAIGLVAEEKEEFDEEIYKYAAGLLYDDFEYITSNNYQAAVNQALSN